METTEERRDGSLLRPKAEDAEIRVSNAELFFDLVFVYAVTQLSHGLLKDLSVLGALRTGLLFLAVWWVWIYTSWVTNWLDPERTAVRLLLFVLMLAGLVLSISIPQAFGDRPLAFAASYVFMQVGRTAFTLWAMWGESEAGHRNFQRILCWLSLSGATWIAGGFCDGDARLWLWCAALAIEYASASLGFWTPGLGRSTTADWNVDGGHLSERCSLFVIIALGESLLVTGATFEQAEASIIKMLSFVIAVIGSIAMWWIYFDSGAARAGKKIKESSDPGRLGRLAYTYIHLLIVAGIIVAAVADELVLTHPEGHGDAGAIATMIGGPALYLLGNLLFKWVIAKRPPLSHLIGLAALAIVGTLSFLLEPLLLYACATAVLILVAIWERLSLVGRLT